MAALRGDISFRYLKQFFLVFVSPAAKFAPCSYGRAPTYQISLTYLERQKCYGPDKKIVILLVFKKLYLTLRSTVKVP
jgi:hypothetical protein